jgi:hypothetical protein
MAGLPEVFGEVVMNEFVFQILMRDLSDSRVCLSIISRALSATTIMYSTYNSCRRFLSQRCLKQHQSNTEKHIFSSDLLHVVINTSSITASIKTQLIQLL